MCADVLWEALASSFLPVIAGDELLSASRERGGKLGKPEWGGLVLVMKAARKGLINAFPYMCAYLADFP